MMYRYCVARYRSHRWYHAALRRQWYFSIGKRNFFCCWLVSPNSLEEIEIEQQSGQRGDEGES